MHSEFGSEPEVKRLLERHRYAWEDSIKIYLKNRMGRSGLHYAG
jgi:hypothetical protein